MENKPIIKAVPSVWDFGRVDEGKTKEKVFKIRNVSGKKIVIDEVKSCCGYSIKNISRWNLAPGESLTVSVLFDSAGKNAGIDEKYISLALKGNKGEIIKLPVRADVALNKERAKDEVPSVTVEELNSFIKTNENIIILDVREKSEFTEKHIPQSRNFPRSSVVLVKDLPRELMKDLEKSSMIIVCCGIGARSSFIAAKLNQSGYNAYNLTGGLKEWEDNGFELVKGPKIAATDEPIAMSLEEAYEHYYKIFKSQVVWVDVRTSEDYNKGHIKGAINIELNNITASFEKLPQDKSIVLYCDGAGCGQSFTAGRILIQNGYKQGKVRVLKDGYELWDKMGLPTVKMSKVEL